ncbi:hypothetical protein [Sorangium sp. So ce513]|uniref:hypothetical protein n=1 Tax=Sorangium sp. So ce513 TaxID=3133315 RepID=UPI003F5D5847
MNSRPPFPSSPPSQPSPYRYLGRGGSERPVRLQIIIALVAGLIVVAVPLYLWRRPRPAPIPSADAATADAGAYALDAGALASADAGLPEPVTLSPFTTIRCENPGPGRTPPERCDHITFFEDGLSRAIRDNVQCAPTGKSSITVSFVLDMDFRRKRTNLYIGKSTTVSRTRTKELLRCVKRAMPTPDWATIPHQYVKYKINVMATYPASESL